MLLVKELNNAEKNLSWSNLANSGLINMIASYNLAKVLTCLYKLGLIKMLIADETISLNEYNDYDPYLLRHLCRYLAIHGLLIMDENGNYKLSGKGQSLFSDESIAHLCFYSEAYDCVTSNIHKMLSGESTYGREILRDGKSLGIHCDTLFKKYHSATVLEAMDDLKCDVVLDIGCGGGQFLIDVCKARPNLRGIGIDISEPAISYAKQNASNACLKDRLEFWVADAFDIDVWPEECFFADLLCATGVVHEHFRDGEDAVIEILNSYADLLSKNFKAFILGEPELRYDLVNSDVDLYLVHIFTAQGFPHHREEWLQLFYRTRLKCDRIYTRPGAGPRFNFFVLTLK